MGRWFPGDKISRIHGQERRFDGLTVMPMYHPAAALRAGAVKALLEADFARVPDVVIAAAKNRQMATTPESIEQESIDQLPLF
jgi:uracil-DNA glycosylase